MACRLVASILGSVMALSGQNEDIILPPVYSGEDLPERLLIFLPGALVPTENYRLTMEAVQKATTGIRLTVVVPSMVSKKCILQCFSKSTCAILKHTVDKAVQKSGFQGGKPEEDTFVAGHSMGSICANNLVAGYGYGYAGLLAYGGYVDETGESSLDNYSIPVLTMAGELDGGAARPGKLALYYQQFKNYAEAADKETALSRKPVQVLPGMDHSDFCPGFFVTAIKDLKSEVSQDVALAAIGQGSAAFLQLNSPTTQETKEKALQTMREMLSFTAEVLDPCLAALSLEQSDGQGPWCETAQHTLSGLNGTDVDELMVNTELVPISDFEHGRTNYTKIEGGLLVNVVAGVEASTGFGPADNHGAAKSVDCKMVSADRIAEQLPGVETQFVQCAEVNKLAVETARNLMPAHSLKRFDAQGRQFCYKDDSDVFGDIGPLFVKGSIKTEETSECLEITSLSLVSGIESKIFPGNHYCKLFSPAMAMEWMMTDGLKPFPYDLTGDDVVGEISV